MGLWQTCQIPTTATRSTPLLSLYLQAFLQTCSSQTGFFWPWSNKAVHFLASPSLSSSAHPAPALPQPKASKNFVLNPKKEVYMPRWHYKDSICLIKFTSPKETFSSENYQMTLRTQNLKELSKNAVSLKKTQIGNSFKLLKDNTQLLSKKPQIYN